MADSIDRSRVIFGNAVSDKDYQAACKSKERFINKFGDDTDAVYHLAAVGLPVIGDALGVRNLVMATDGAPLDIAADAEANGSGSPLVVGNIRMGFGHYRIAMAIASAAHALGYTPYWFDLASFGETTGSKIISYQNELYSMGSRLSQQVPPFNALYWEPLNSEGFRKLSYNASDQKNAELMTPILQDLPKDVPFVGTHVWPAQAAVHAGLTHVVNAIPDNWPMALHLAEGAIHAVQTPSAYLGYKQLRGMAGKQTLTPMPSGALRYTGHYIDAELVDNVASDCAARRARLEGAGPVRYLLTVGGAGAQSKLFADIIEHLIPYVQAGEAALFINVGDHKNVAEDLCKRVPQLEDMAISHFDDFGEVAAFAAGALTGTIEGVHVFYDADIFAAVYATNLLMRACDVLVTKPGELAFYPVPKLMIHRVGGHEAWSAIRAEELGDGTYEIDETPEVLAMIDSFQHDRSLVAFMCDNIEKNAQYGIYDGAFEVVKLAVAGM